MASPEIWVEVWKRLGHASFGRQIADLPVMSAGGTVPVNGYGNGTMTLPKNYDRFDDILKPDVTTPANAISSLVRVFSKNSTTPIYEWIPNLFAAEQDKTDPGVEISGPAIDAILGYARVEAWDWTGIDDEQSQWPDWIYGGRNILGDLESAYKPAVTRLYRESTVTAGTFTIGISFDGGAISNTGNIAFNATAATLDTDLTAELVSMGFASAAIEVSGSGSEADPWRIETISPEGEYVFSVNSGGLTGGLVLQTREFIGAIIPAGYTTSFNPVNNLSHGSVSVFRASHFVSPDPSAPACADGVAIMFDGDTGDFPGIQKIVPVKPGGRYYASATAYAQGATGTYRFVIRDLYENPIGADPDFDSGTTITANTWTAFDSMTSVVIPADVDRVIVRFAAVDGGNPPPTFVTCLELREGMPPTTWGDIWTQLYDDATTDHAGRVVWEIGATGTPYLTLDFNAVNDSNGNPWTHPEVSITLKRGQNYTRVGSECYKMGYEGRIVPDNVATGTYKFQLYNTGGMGTNHSLVSTGPSIQGGRDVTRRDLRRFLPPATDVAVEAGQQNIGRARNTSAVSALGRIEQYIPNQDLGSLLEAGTVADLTVAENLQRSQSFSYVLTPTQLDPEPFIAYKAADTVYVMDPPDIPTRTARRIKSLGFAFTKEKVEYPIQLESESFVGVGPSIASSVDFLMKEFKAIRESPDETTDPLNYFGGGGNHAPSVLVAAADSSEVDKAHADMVCAGVNDNPMIWAALDLARSGFPAALPGWVHFSAGHYQIDMSADPAFDCQDLMITGVGYGYSGNGTVFRLNGAGASTRPFVFEGEYSIFRDFGIEDVTSYNRSITGIAAGELTLVDNVQGWTSGHFIEILGNSVTITNINVLFNGYGGDTGPNHCISMSQPNAYVRISGNTLLGCDGYGVHVMNGTSGTEVCVISGNIIEGCGTGGIYLGVQGMDLSGTTGSRWSWSVTGNTIEGCSGDWSVLADLHASIFLEYAPGTSVVGNTITNAFGHGIILASDGTGGDDPWIGSGGGCVVSGNSITRTTGYPIWFYNPGATVAFYPVTVTANHIGADGSDASNIVRLDRIRDVSIQANNFQFCGIYLLECEQVSVLGNKFLAPGYGGDAGTTGKTGIVELDDSHVCTVKTNDFQAVEGAVNVLPRACVYLVNGSDDNRIRDNDYQGTAAIDPGATLLDYGVWFAASSGANNKAVGNDFSLVSTANIQDDVTGNTIIWPGAGNDNW